MRPAACTADHLRTQAQRDPARLALHEDGAGLSYGQIDRLVRGCRRALRELGVRAGECVAVAGAGVGPQLVVLLAAESLGCITASVASREPVGAVLAQVDRVFTGEPFEVPPGVPVHRIDRAFIGSWTAGPADEDGACLVADAPARITSTSGSSGRPRVLSLSHAVLDWRIRALLDVPGWQLGPGSRLLVLAPLVVNASYLRICGSLRHGGAVVVAHDARSVHLAPTHVTGLPSQLERLLDQLPPGFAASVPVAVSTIGGRVPPALAGRVRAAWGTDVQCRYGTNETSTICTDLDATATGPLETGVAVRILDEAGRDVAPGDRGVIAVRSPAMVDGYLDDAQASADAFRDGWFVTGDVGCLRAPRVLQLLGRHDDLVVVGGIKVPAAVLEDEVRKHPAVAECAVLTLHGDGRTGLAVVAVLHPSAGHPSEAARELAASLRLEAETECRLLLVPALPRLPGGKVDRVQLLRQLRQPG